MRNEGCQQEMCRFLLTGGCTLRTTQHMLHNGHMAVTELRLVPPPAGSLGHRIKCARGFRRLTQDGLREQMADPPSRRTLSDWENDKHSPSVDRLHDMAEVLDFPVEWFVIDDGATYEEDLPTGRDVVVGAGQTAA